VYVYAVAGRHALPPRAHNHSTAEPAPPCVASPLPLSRTSLGSPAARSHDPPPPPPPPSSSSSLLDRFLPSTTLGGVAARFPGELAAVNGMRSGGAGSGPGLHEPVSMMTSRRPPGLSSPGAAGHLPATKTHRAIKCYHCRMCEQVRESLRRCIYSWFALYCSTACCIFI